MHETEAEILDRVRNGDVVVTKDGAKVRKPLSGKDLVHVHAIVHDKRAMIRGEPTSRTEKVDPMKVIREAAELLQKQGQAKSEDVAHAEWEPIPEDELRGDRRDH